MIVALMQTLLPLLLAATTDAAAPVPTMRLAADTVRADERGMWSISMTFHNPGIYGLYGDSLFVDITNLDAGVSRAPRRSMIGLPGIIHLTGTLGAGEEKTVPLSFVAPCERAALTLRVYSHGGNDGPKYLFRDSLVAEPGDLATSHPSTFLEVKGKRVEYVAVTTSTAGPVPGVLLVPSETAHARSLLLTASQLAERGMNAVTVSPPGYGLSDGPADMAGPATIAALDAALRKLASLPGTDPKRLAVWGAGRGATAALLLAARHPELVKVVAQDAGYDLWASWRSADPATAADIRDEAGADSAGWKARSPLLVPSPSQPRLLMIQGAGTEEAARAARAYAAARQAAGAWVDTLLAFPATSRLTRDPVRVATDFLFKPGQN